MFQGYRVISQSVIELLLIVVIRIIEGQDYGIIDCLRVIEIQCFRIFNYKFRIIVQEIVEFQDY